MLCPITPICLPKGISIVTGNISYAGEEIAIKSVVQMEKYKPSSYQPITIDESFQAHMKDLLELRESNKKLVSLLKQNVTEGLSTIDLNPKSLLSYEVLTVVGVSIRIITLIIQCCGGNRVDKDVTIVQEGGSRSQPEQPRQPIVINFTSPTGEPLR